MLRVGQPAERAVVSRNYWWQARADIGILRTAERTPSRLMQSSNEGDLVAMGTIDRATAKTAVAALRNVHSSSCRTLLTRGILVAVIEFCRRSQR